MRAHRETVTVAADHRVAVTLPEDFPAGPAEVIVLAEAPQAQRLVKLAGVLAPDREPPPEADPIAEALAELRRERGSRFEGLKLDA
jgi:hypothetical protein